MHLVQIQMSPQSLIVLTLFKIQSPSCYLKQSLVIIYKIINSNYENNEQITCVQHSMAQSIHFNFRKERQRHSTTRLKPRRENIKFCTSLHVSQSQFQKALGISISPVLLPTICISLVICFSSSFIPFISCFLQPYFTEFLWALAPTTS